MDLMSRLYDICDEQGIDVDYWLTSKAPALCVALPDGAVAIALNPSLLRTVTALLMAFAHEVGHGMTGALYRPDSPQWMVDKSEHKAWVWIIEHLITPKDLKEAVSQGYTEPWELAEYFGVPEEFIKKVVTWHKYHNLDVA